MHFERFTDLMMCGVDGDTDCIENCGYLLLMAEIF